MYAFGTIVIEWWRTKFAGRALEPRIQLTSRTSPAAKCALFRHFWVHSSSIPMIRKNAEEWSSDLALLLVKPINDSCAWNFWPDSSVFKRDSYSKWKLCPRSSLQSSEKDHSSNFQVPWPLRGVRGLPLLLLPGLAGWIRRTVCRTRSQPGRADALVKKAGKRVVDKLNLTLIVDRYYYVG